MLTTQANSEEPQPIAVSIVLPCHNEAPHLLTELSRITTAFEQSDCGTFEIIVIDDGSTDHSAALLRQLDQPTLRVITHPRQHGAGAARRTGTQVAHGTIIVWTDCDMTYPNERLPELVHTLTHTRGAEQVIGSRLQEAGTHRYIRRAIKEVIRRRVQHKLSTPIHDLNSGMRTFYRSSASQAITLIPDGFSCTSTMTIAFILEGRPIHFVDIPYAKRSGTSKFRPLRDSYLLTRQIARVLNHYGRTQ